MDEWASFWDDIERHRPGLFERKSSSSSSGERWRGSSRQISKKSQRCGQCHGCLLARDCGCCKFCLDKPKNGGSGRWKQGCVLRRCLPNLKEDTEGQTDANDRSAVAPIHSSASNASPSPKEPLIGAMSTINIWQSSSFTVPGRNDISFEPALVYHTRRPCRTEASSPSMFYFPSMALPWPSMLPSSSVL